MVECATSCNGMLACTSFPALHPSFVACSNNTSTWRPENEAMVALSCSFQYLFLDSSYVGHIATRGGILIS